MTRISEIRNRWTITGIRILLLLAHFAISTGLLSNTPMFPEPHFIKSNGIRMAVYEQGTGPAVILVHGFPELAYSWRHLLPALANVGFRAIAPDMRGYGLTDGPEAVESYRVAELIADLHGLLDSLDIERACFIGHDWGALILWQMAMLAPDRIEKLIILNIPHYPRPSTDPVELMRKRFGDGYYVVNFQGSDEAEKAFAARPEHFFDMMMRKNQITRAQFDLLPRKLQGLDLLKMMQREKAGGEALLTKKERDYYVQAFSRSGFRNPVNWYRNWSANWRALEGVDQVIDIPTLFIGAVDDVVIRLEQLEPMKSLVTNLSFEMLQPCGHWTQQERPDDVNRLIVDWLKHTSSPK